MPTGSTTTALPAPAMAQRQRWTRHLLVLVVLGAVASLPATGRSERAQYIDLHSHFSGAVSARGLYKIAVEHNVDYPLALVEQAGIELPLEWRAGRRPSIPMRTLDGLLTRTQHARFLRAMSAGRTDFDGFEARYRMRAPLTKNIELVPDIVLAIARESRRVGVNYLELSAGSVLTRDGNAAVIRGAVAAAERQTGVRLRFLLAFDRHAPVQENIKTLLRARKGGLLAPGAPIVGIDIKGYETNPVTDQAGLILRAAALRRRYNPRFQVRVHAGETPDGAANVYQAARLGATRIGHGVHGMTPAAIRLLSDKQVIVEVNTTSNRQLGFYPGAGKHPLRELLRAGVPVTVSTDSAGLFRTNVRRELRKTARALHLTRGERAQILRVNRRYLAGVARFDAPKVPLRRGARAALVRPRR